MYLLVMYDIGDDKRRYRIEKTLSFYGHRVNYSVFELEVTASNFKKIITLLEKQSHVKEDHIRIYILGRESLKKSFVLHRKERIFDYEALYL